MPYPIVMKFSALKVGNGLMIGKLMSTELWMKKVRCLF